MNPLSALALFHLLALQRFRAAGIILLKFEFIFSHGRINPGKQMMIFFNKRSMIAWDLNLVKGFRVTGITVYTVNLLSTFSYTLS